MSGRHPGRPWLWGVWLAAATTASGASSPVPTDPFEECDAAVRAAPAAYESYLCFYRRGVQEDALSAAAGRLDELRAARSETAWPLLVRAHAARSLGDQPQRCLELYREAAALFAAQPEPVGEIIARNNLRDLFLSLGDRRSAEEQVHRALAAAERSDSLEAKTRAALMEAAHLTRGVRQLGRAHRSILRAQAAVTQIDSPVLEQLVLDRLAELAYFLGRHDEAIDALEHLIALRREFGNLGDLPILRYGIANNRLAQREERPIAGALEEIGHLAREALAAARAGEDAYTEARAHALLGDVAAPTDAALADRHYQKCFALARTLERRHAEMDCLWSWARSFASRRPAEAEQALERAALLAVAEEDHRYAAFVWQARLRSAWSLWPEDRAVREALEALDAVERTRAAQLEADARIGAFSAWTKDYYLVVGRLLEAARPDLELAFEVSERLRARVLLEALQRSELPTQASVADDENRALHTRRFAGISQLQQRLAPDEAIIAYVVGLDRDLYQEFGGGAWAFVISSNKAFTVRVPGRLELEAMVPAFVGLVAAGGGSLERAATALYRNLLGEALTRLGPEVERLVIVPDGVLHRLPFEALRTEIAEPSLGVRYELSTAPSATLWSRWRVGQGEQGPRIPRRTLVLADPELPAGSRSRVPRSGSLLERDLDLGPLPYARREGRRVCTALRGSCRLLAGAEASEAALESAGDEPIGILHLAAHAVVDEAFPARSAVLLAPGADDEDGLLQPTEAARLAIEPSVVVLSGCRTAAGPVAGGEGVLSLARPFLEGGARAVLASRWPLRDDEAAAFFGWLYERIARGDRLTAALRHARSRAEQAGLSRETTAGVFLLGDGSARLEPRVRTLRAAPVPWWVIPALPVLALLLVAWRRRAASHRLAPLP